MMHGTALRIHLPIPFFSVMTNSDQHLLLNYNIISCSHFCLEGKTLWSGKQLDQIRLSMACRIFVAPFITQIYILQKYLLQAKVLRQELRKHRKVLIYNLFGPWELCTLTKTNYHQ